MEAAAALVPSLGLLSAPDVLGGAEARRRDASARPETAPRAATPPAEQTADDAVLLGELVSAGRPGRPGTDADADGDSVLPGSPMLRNAFARGGGLNAHLAVQSYEEQRRAGYVQELRQSTAIDLYV